MHEKLNVLLIGYPRSRVRYYLSKNENLAFIDGSEVIVKKTIDQYQPDLIVLHGCHSILDKTIVSGYPRKIINLHGAYLPWNRGCHPNLWSFLDGTPKGGSIHYIDQYVDQGELIARRKIKVLPEDTLATTYERVKNLMEDMFIELWPLIRVGKAKVMKTNYEEGSYHARKDLESVKHLLRDGWNTKVNILNVS